MTLSNHAKEIIDAKNAEIERLDDYIYRAIMTTADGATKGLLRKARCKEALSDE